MTYLFLYLQFILGSLLYNEPDTVKISFFGDLMQHKEQLSSALKRGANPNQSSSYDYSCYFKNIATILQDADYSVVNMETTFPAPPFSGYPVFGSPASLAKETKEAGFDLFLSANNHICDRKSSGISGAINLFDTLNVDYIGIYRDSDHEEKSYPLIKEISGIKVAFLNYTYGTNGLKTPTPFIVKRLDSATIKRDIFRATLYKPDVIIACIHWGEEYKLKNNSEQLKWKSLFNRNGVKIIIGSHPHVPQNFEYTESGDSISDITIFSLGNFISNMSAPFTRISLCVTLNLKKCNNGKVTILKPDYEYLWTTRPGEFEKGYSVIRIKEFLDNPERFKVRDSYDKMKHYYSILTK